MLRGIKREIKQHIKDNIKGYILIFGVFMAGMALSYILNISSGSEGEVKAYIDEFLSTIKNYGTDSKKTFSFAMQGYVKSILIFFIMSLSLIGSVGSLIYVFVKGFSYGIVVICIFKIMGTKAFLMLLCLIFPHTLILIPCFTEYALYCFKNAWSVSKGVKDIGARIFMPLVNGVICVALLSVSALIQAYLEPVLTRVIIG